MALKKVMSFVLILCLLAVTVPAMAESDTEAKSGARGMGALMHLLESLTQSEAEGDGENAGTQSDMSALLGVLGAMTGAPEGGESGAEGGMDALLGLVDGILGGSGEGASAMPEYTAVVADSIEQFYGSWSFSRAFLRGTELSPSLLALLGTTASATMIIEEEKISMVAKLGDIEKSYTVDSTEESKYVIGMALSDGALDVTMEGETFVFQLTDNGEMVCDLGDGIALFFTAA